MPWRRIPASNASSRRPAHPIAGIRHAAAAIAGGKHVVMVNVEADVLCGPLLAARRARKTTWSIPWPMATSRR